MFLPDCLLPRDGRRARAPEEYYRTLHFGWRSKLSPFPPPKAQLLFFRRDCVYSFTPFKLNRHFLISQTESGDSPDLTSSERLPTILYLHPWQGGQVSPWDNRTMHSRIAPLKNVAGGSSWPPGGTTDFVEEPFSLFEVRSLVPLMEDNLMP